MSLSPLPSICSTSVNNEEQVKPRSLRFTWSMKTTSSRDPNDIMAEIRKVDLQTTCPPCTTNIEQPIQVISSVHVLLIYFIYIIYSPDFYYHYFSFHFRNLPFCFLHTICFSVFLLPSIFLHDIHSENLNFISPQQFLLGDCLVLSNSL